MIVEAILNKENDLPKNLHEYALTQDGNGELDVSVGKHYAVYAVRQNNLGERYLVHTERMNPDALWWMPAEIYKEVDSTKPFGW